jgi:YidC/Oxa1 family membrane protein insertase
MSEQKNLIVVILLSLGILFGFHYFYEVPKQEKLKAHVEQVKQQERQQTPAEAVPQNNIQPSVPESIVSRTEALKKSARVTIDTPRLQGSISLRGGIIDDLLLKDFKETLEKNSPHIHVLSPFGTKEPYFADFGWMSADTTLKLPNAESVWVCEDHTLTPEKPIVLKWDNGQGLIFEEEIAVDKDFMFTVKQRVKNSSSNAVKLYPYTLLSKTGTPELLGFSILHEGLIGVFNEKLKEVEFKEIQKKNKLTFESKGGWLGMTDKYLLVAIAPEHSENITADFIHSEKDKADKYQFDYHGSERTVASGQTVDVTSRLFVGAKELKVLTKYAEDLKIDRFDLALDFGWLYFLTKPIFYFLSYMYELIGNFGLCILLLTVCIRLVLFPLANNSFKAMSKMRLLTPEITRLREMYGQDKMKLQQEIMALYKREKVNPMAGCLPILVQIPVFFALYKVLFISIEMRHAPFVGWIRDLSAPDPTSIFNAFGLLPFEAPIHLGAWPIIMGITMFVQQKMTPAPADPTQAKMMMFMPVVFTALLANFPAGLVIYWSWSNMLSIGQQWLISRNVKLEKSKAVIISFFCKKIAKKKNG